MSETFVKGRDAIGRSTYLNVQLKPEWETQSHATSTSPAGDDDIPPHEDIR
jgi:hypothetical protein